MDGQPSHRTNRGVYNHSASRSSSYLLGKRGTAGRPAPSWAPNIRRDGTYDSRPPISIRKVKTELFRKVEPEIGSRVFISGLPKDITNQDLEDFVSQSVGPVHEAYVVYQYSGQPLYTDATPTAGPRRNYDAEVWENMRYVTSTGCGMVHFQRAKDAMEAWEQFHGRIFDTNKNEALRVQVVLDPDETWLLQVGDQPLEGKPEPMKPESIPEPDPPANSSTTSKDLGTPDNQRRNKRTVSTGVVSSVPLIQRLGLSGQSNGFVTLGSHSVGVAPPMPNTRPVAAPTSAAPRGKAKKGPARLRDRRGGYPVPILVPNQCRPEW